MKKVAFSAICLLVFFSISAQERFLRKAKSALDENDFNRAFSLVANYEGKEGVKAESMFMRFLILQTSGTSISEQDAAWEVLQFATRAYGSLSEKAQKEWCSEIDFCADRFPFYEREADLKLFETYKQPGRIDTITLFINKYPNSKWNAEAKVYKSYLAFNEAKLLDTEEAYLNFLKAYSAFPHADTAKSYLWTAAYRETNTKNTVAAFTRFIKSYPQSPQLEEAKHKLWDLAWKAAVASNKKSDYRTFITTYPEADQVGEAKQKVEAFEWTETKDEASIEAYEKFTKDYPNSIHYTEADSSLQALKKKKQIDDLLKEASENVEGLYFSSAEELLSKLDTTAPATAFRTKDSLLARIKYLRPMLRHTLGKYSFNSNGVEVILLFGVNESDSSLYCMLKGFSKGEEISGVESDGSFGFGPSGGKLNIEWQAEEFNKSMSAVTISLVQNKPILKLSNGTVYKKISNDFESEIESSVKRTVKPTPATKKTYITMCGEQYEKGTDFADVLPSGWEDRVGFYCLKNYREGAEEVWVVGANNNGILIKATGELTGNTYTILYTCDGDLF